MQSDRRVLWTLLWKSLEQQPLPQAAPATAATTSPPPRSPHGTLRSPTVSAMMSATRLLPDGSPSEWITGILLAVWDNVAGPRVERAWLSEPATTAGQQAETTVTQEALHEVARDALAGTLEDNLVVKFVALPHGGSVVVSAAFTAPWGEEAMPTKLSIALFARREHIRRATCMYRVIEDRLMFLALVARTVLVRCPETAMDRLGDEVCRAAAALDAAHRAGIDSADDADAFGRAVYAASVAFGVDLVSRAITSHLQTRGFTVVVGPDEPSVNAVIDCLAVFLDPRERALSSRASVASVRYQPDLVLQGVVGTLASAGVDEEQLVHAPLPTTVVDLSSPSRNVWQPRSNSEFVVSRREYFKIVFQKICPSTLSVPLPPPPPQPLPLHPVPQDPSTPVLATPIPLQPVASVPEKPAAAAVAAAAAAHQTGVPATPQPKQTPQPQQEWLPKEGLLVPVTQSSSLVLDLLCQTLRLPTILRLAYVRFSCRLVTSKAVTLLKLINSDIKAHKGSTESSGRWLKDNLGLADDADLNVVFAFAERLSPGICMTMMADRLTLEEKFIELFEGFV